MFLIVALKNFKTFNNANGDVSGKLCLYINHEKKFYVYERRTIKSNIASQLHKYKCNAYFSSIKMFNKIINYIGKRYFR